MASCWFDAEKVHKALSIINIIIIISIINIINIINITLIIVITQTTCINYVMKIIGERLRVLDLACLVKARQAQVSTCIEFTNPPLRWQVPLPFL